MKKAFVFALCILASYSVFAQSTDRTYAGPNQLSERMLGTDGGTESRDSDALYPQLTIPDYFVLLSRNLRQAFATPFRMKAKDWANAGKFAAVAGALAFLDEPVQQGTSRLISRNTTGQNISRQVTNFGAQYETYLLAGLGTCGFLFKKEKLKTTTLLATQAYLTSAAIGKLVKFATNRQRPFVGDSILWEVEPTFRGPFYKRSLSGARRTNSSFPSGHTTAAFAVATVFAMQYRDHPIIPVLAYSAASLVGLSRLTENKHWATDVLAGAALGYLCGKMTFSNFQLLAHGKTVSRRPAALKFNFGYERGRVVAGLFYMFN